MLTHCGHIATAKRYTGGAIRAKESTAVGRLRHETGIEVSLAKTCDKPCEGVVTRQACLQHGGT
jgi:hypothetical protein